MTTPEPRVSVVMPAHNGWEWTARALDALDAAGVDDLEVVVVDDASSDGTAERLARRAGLNAVRLDRNAGFQGAVDAGVAASTAPLLVLLNNDTEVTEGWLAPLVATIEADRGIAAVAPRLLHADGTLQESGCCLWGDAVGDTWGDGGDPAAATVSFRRDVDYASAACLLVRRSAWADAGGFDPAYHPAYYEDADLAMRWREQGGRVVVDPRSTVRHARWATTGPPAGRIPLIVRNRAEFLRRWGPRLAGRPPHRAGAPEEVRLAVRDAGCSEVILAPWLDPADAAGLAELGGAAAVIASAAPAWRVTLVAPAATAARLGELAARWRAAGVEVDAADDWNHRLAVHSRLATALLGLEGAPLWPDGEAPPLPMISLRGDRPAVGEVQAAAVLQRGAGPGVVDLAAPPRVVVADLRRRAGLLAP